MYSLYLFSLISVSQALYSEPQIRHVSSRDLYSLVENPDYLTMSIIYDKSTQGSVLLSNVLSDLIPKYENYVKFLALDCDTEPELCRQDIREQLPVFQGYVPAGINPYTGKPLVREKAYQGLISAKDIGNYLSENVAYLGEILTQDNIERFQSDDINKVILFTNKDKVPIIYKGLTSKFRGLLEFGVVFLNQSEIISQFDITEFPSLIVLKGDDIVTYKEKIDFHQISSFLDDFKLAEKRPPKVKKIQNKPKEPAEPQVKLPDFPITTLTSNNYKDYLIEESGLFLVHFYKEKHLEEWDFIKENYNGVLKLANFQCKKEDLEICGSLGAKKFPSVRIFPVNRKRKSFELSASNKEDFEEEISRELRYDIMAIQEATVQTFINSIHEEGKVGLLLMNEGPIPLQIRGLAAEESFRDFVKFGYFNRPKEITQKIFSIKNYPAFMAFVKTDDGEQVRVMEYNGKFNDFANLYYFVDEMAIPSLSSKKKKKVSEEDQEDIDVISTSSSFNAKCVRKTGICVIGLFEGTPEESKQYKVLKNTKSQIDQKNLPAHFIAIDGRCQNEIRESFGISEISLPNIGVFYAAKKKGARLVGKFTVDDISNFIEGVLRGKVELFDLKKLDFSEKNCDTVEEVEETGEDEILNEILKKAEEKEEDIKTDTKRGRRRRKSKTDL